MTAIAIGIILGCCALGAGICMGIAILLIFVAPGMLVGALTDAIKTLGV